MIKEIITIPLASLLSRLRRSLKMIKKRIARRGISLRRIRDGPTSEAGSIILNPAIKVGKSIQYIQDYFNIHCYLDNDVAGRNATSILFDRLGNLIDRSNPYSQFNDLNEYLIHTIQSANAINSNFSQNKKS